MRRLWAAATAMLVCLALGGAPVTGQSPTPVPAGGVSIEVLSDRAVIPIEAFPVSTQLAAFWRVTIAPGVSGTLGSRAPHSYAQVGYVQQGTSTGTSDSDLRVWHLDGLVEDIPAGVEYSSPAGETGLVFDGGAGGRLENGPEPYVELVVAIGDTNEPAVERAPIAGVTGDLNNLAGLEYAQLKAMLSAPIAVTFQRVTLDPGASLVLGAEDIPMLTFTGVDSGSVMWGRTSAAEPTPPPIGTQLDVGSATHWFTPPSDAAIIVWNAAEEPAVLLQAVLSPVTE